MTEIMLTPVVSDSIHAYHYDPEYKNLLVVFRNGGTYVYHDCPPALAARFDKRHPWRRIYADVKALDFDPVSKGIQHGPKIRKRKVAGKTKLTAKVKK